MIDPVEMAIRRDLHRMRLELEQKHFMHAIEMAILLDEALDLFGF